MTRAWIGTALLAGSWLFGQDYFAPARPIAWIASIVAAVLLLSATNVRWPSRRLQMLALLLAFPAIWPMAFPFKSIPLLICGGLFLQLIPVPRHWPRDLGRGAVIAGTILLAQSLILIIYEIFTARSHELPQPLAVVVGAVTRLLGVDSAVEGSSVVCRSIQEQMRIGATWELLFDPATVCFVVGGMVMLTLVNWGGRQIPADRHWWRQSVIRLLFVIALWVPLRIAFLVALILHRMLRADAVAFPNVSDVMVNSWLHVVLVVVLALIVARVLRFFTKSRENAYHNRLTIGARTQLSRSQIACPILIATGIAVLTFLFFWNPVGERQSGRVMIVERHSTWEPTTEPYGTNVYGEAGSYNYAAAYAYCQQYYQMSRLLEADAIRDASLAHCDVLVIKTPTARYSIKEIDAVVRFVDRGGSLLMVGDHTNVFNMNTYLNDIARVFGFTFRNDLLFRIGDPYKQSYRPPRVAHPVVQDVPPMHFAVSCSIDPGHSLGRMVIRNTGLWSLPPAYHESNYHPQAEYATPMHYGAWCQLWSTTHGAGRVLAFADSTLFSNFCVFQPGKAELLRGMLEWLNHTSPFDRRGPKLLMMIPAALAGVLMFAIGCWLGRQNSVHWLVVLSATLCGWCIAVAFVNGVHRAQFPVPPKPRPIPHVVIDRTLSDVPLHTGAFSDAAEGVGYGMLEQWIPRIGNFTSRQSGEDVFHGDAVVFICPTRSVHSDFRHRLVEFVRDGGHVLVVDSIDVDGSTANSLLWPFGLASNHDTQLNAKGVLKWLSESSVALSTSCEITGGETLGYWKGLPVAARARLGKGSVTAIGFGSLFDDANMGTHWLPEPEQATLERYEALYAILRASLLSPSPAT